MIPEPFRLEVQGTTLTGDRWGHGDPLVVMLHEGVADRRSWQAVAQAVADRATAITYDRRGFGETPPPSDDFSHVEDLLQLVDATSTEPIWLAGTSAGGSIALDAALAAPERIAGLLLLAPGVSGAPAPALDDDTARFDRLLDEALEAGDLHEVNRLETWLWLDGPSQPEGRVGGDIRALALDMNAIIIENDVPQGAGASGMSAWEHLEDIDVPATVACGDLDVPFLIDRSRQLADRLPQGSHRVLEGIAHLSELEAPAVITELLCALCRL